MKDRAGQRIEGSRDRERAPLGLSLPVEPFANTIPVLVLQHPQEPDKALGTAALLTRALERATLRVGLSWRSLKTLAGDDAVASEWAVLYLGSRAAPLPEAVNFLSQKGNPVPRPPVLRGLIVLDGSWSQVKALWWRNPWMLKLRRVALRPAAPSRYGRLRKEPRPDALSTIESCALALEELDPAGGRLRAHLENAFERMLAEYRRGGGPATAPPAAP